MISQLSTGCSVRDRRRRHFGHPEPRPRRTGWAAHRPLSRSVRAAGSAVGVCPARGVGGAIRRLSLPSWVEVRQPAAIPETVSRNTELDRGEAEALALAVEMHADAVLIDKAAGRHAALELGLTPVGVLGILVRAKRYGQLAAVAPVIDALLARAQFRVSPELLREVLRMAGEGP